MKFLLAIVLAALVLRPASAQTDTGPEDFLAPLIAGDFSGDPEARFDRSFYPDGRTVALGCVNRDCGERREVFDSRTDPLIIVTRWEIVGTAWETKAKALVKVRYTVIGTAEGNNIHRKITPLPAPREDEATYKVWKRKGQWFWVDPPEVPHVGYEGVRTALKKHIAHFEELIAEKVDNPLVERHLPFYRQQLAALEALRPMAAPPSSP